MTGFDRIVVALAGAESDRSIIAYAALLARLGEATEVRFVHVDDSSTETVDRRDCMRAMVGHTFAESSAAIEYSVLHGSITDQLLAFVTEVRADLLLIGSKKHKLGARLAMVGSCSVAIVPANHPATLSHLLVAIDFSNAAEDTLEWATTIAAGDRSIRCTALHVMTHESADLFASDEDEDQQAATLREIVDGSNRHRVPVKTRLASVARTTEVGRHRSFFLPASIQGADVAHAILAEAEAVGADCIALSTRGRSRSASILLGSVAEKVIERSPIPLLVGKHRGRNLGLAAILLGQAGGSVDIKTN